ncbi:MAG: dihydropteroate synthase [Rhizobiales bacterium]|nr:dihydropteroate synthase [Hyphomicrobiales bacterium]
MAERLVLLTGHLAKARLEKLMTALGDTGAEWAVIDIGVKVAALMSEQIVLRRLTLPEGTDRVVLPGRFRGSLETLSAHFGVPFERGPDELADLPAYLGRPGGPPDLSRYDIRIFAEIVDASMLSLDRIVARADTLAAAGANVIDLGCLPETPFPLLGEAVAALKGRGLSVSVDSASREELETGARAGADYLLSLDENSLPLAFDHPAVPVLIPSVPGDLDSLGRAIEAASRANIRFIADPVLDPIHFGFAASLGRFIEARRRWPEVELLMGTGNLTELTDADSSGVTAVLAGLCSELEIRNVLVVHVSPHTVRTVEEHDRMRRILFAAREDNALPRGYDASLLQVHDRKPFTATPEDIDALAGEVRDANFRIMTAEDGVHIFNAKGHEVVQDAFDLFPKLGVEADGAHAFYLGAELTKAEIAWRLGKRYAQDEPLSFGVAAPTPEGDRARLAEAGHTLRAKKER